MQNCLRWSGHQPLRVLRAAVCCPGGVLRLWLMSGALRMVLISGFAAHLVFAPRPPLVLACFAASPARSARPPQRGSLYIRKVLTVTDQIGRSTMRLKA